MAQVQVPLSGTLVTLNEHPSKCPLCLHHLDPRFLGGAVAESSSPFPQAEVCYQCTNKKCRRLFLGQFAGPNMSGEYRLQRMTPITQEKKEFPASIVRISPLFVQIYNEAFATEQLGLKQICGVGYRKSIEFLIKDYLIEGDSSIAESVKTKMLGQCISENVTDAKIKAVAARATWLGNDETHYVRKWEDKDVKDLKSLIDLTVYWIDSEETTKAVLADMPERKK